MVSSFQNCTFKVWNVIRYEHAIGTDTGPLPRAETQENCVRSTVALSIFFFFFLLISIITSLVVGRNTLQKKRDYAAGVAAVKIR